ncbi:MAG: hypothetical protein KJ601_04665 [Nanoarchaeota archaeon]|nr:hypothetical protein [Nanoarchaeota archaeon]MBU1704034.1 hypothetical protein [Nanoarchaeota archaeon]
MANHISILRWMQLGILVFAILLMLSKTYPFFSMLFSFLYKTHFSIISVIIGLFAVLHGAYMIFMSFKAHKWYREIVEGMIVVAAGLLLLSPEFNTVVQFSFLTFFSHLEDEFISHLAVALVPIVVVYFFDIILRRE